MRRSFVSLFSLVLLAGLHAQAEKQELISLKCQGANGLLLSVKSNSNTVSTELGLFEQKFETNKEVTIYRKDKAAITRLAIGLEKDAKSLVYDIYLASVPQKGKTEKLLGVIGNAIHKVVIFPTYLTPVPVPVGFWPITTLSCSILTK